MLLIIGDDLLDEGWGSGRNLFQSWRLHHLGVLHDVLDVVLGYVGADSLKVSLNHEGVLILGRVDVILRGSGAEVALGGIL